MRKDKKSASKYAKLKPGLYIAGADPNRHPPTLQLIYVISGERLDIEPEGINSGEWHGVVYKYFCFDKQHVYEFNDHWVGFIDGLVPITDQRLVDAAKEQIRTFASRKRKRAEAAAELEAAI